MRPMSIRMSRARRAGKTLTSSSVTPVPSATGMTDERHQREHRRHVEGHGRAASRPRFPPAPAAERHDHPRGLTDRAQEPGMEQAAHGHGRRQQQPQILRQEERRERRDDAAERQKGKKRQEQPRQAEAQQEVAELLVLRQLHGEPERSREQRGAHQEPDRRQTARRAGCLPARRRRARFRDDQTRGSSRYGNGDHQRTSSISWSALPPVSLRNTDGEVRIPAAGHLPELVDRPARDDASLQDDADAIAHLLGHFQRVGAHQDGHAVLAHAAEHVLDQTGAARIQTHHRLVDQYRPRTMEERGAHDQPLFHPVRKALDQLVFPPRELEEIEHLPDAFVRCRRRRRRTGRRESAGTRRPSAFRR